jgi:hypothetical protein
MAGEWQGNKRQVAKWQEEQRWEAAQGGAIPLCLLYWFFTGLSGVFFLTQRSGDAEQFGFPLCASASPRECIRWVSESETSKEPLYCCYAQPLS